MKKVKNKQGKTSQKIKTKKQSAQVIIVKNAEGDADTKAQILVQNKINYTPKVSVIIPVYNVEAYLRQCLDSVIKQTLEEIEIICVDDGSTDSSLEILKEYAAKDKRITVLKQKNLHAGVARNAGLAVARGEYLSFLDSDDFFELNMLEEMYQKASNCHADFCICHVKIYNMNQGTTEKCSWGLKDEMIPSKEVFSVQDLSDYIFQFNQGWVWDKIYKKDFVLGNDIRFQSLRSSNDVYFSFSNLSLAKRIVVCPSYLMTHRLHVKGSLENTREHSYNNIYLAISKIKHFLEKKQLYIAMKKSFVNYAISNIVWNYQTLQEPSKTFLLSIINDFYKDLFYSIKKEEYFDLNKYKIFQEILKLPYLHIDSKYIPIVFATNTNYSIPCSVAIKSLIATANKAKKFAIFILHTELDQSHIQMLETLSTKNIFVKTIRLDLDRMIGRSFLYTRAHYSKEMYYRILIPELLKKFDKVIYLDCDILLRDDISKLYDINIDDFVLAAVINPVIQSKKYIEETLGLDSEKYFNSGILVINNKKFNELNLKQKCIELIKTKNNLKFPDQDILNIVCQNNVYYLDIKWNYQWFFETLEIPLPSYCMDLYKKASKNPSIVHYSSAQKPWNYDDGKYTKEWKKYCKLNYQRAQKQNDAQKLQAWYLKLTGKYLNLDNPRTFNEKIQWLKLYDSTPIKTRLADKYLVRDWVKEKIGEQYLIPLIGVYDKFDDIDFNKLPNQFVIKCNHGSGWNIIVKDKSQLNLAEAKEKIDKWMATDYSTRWGFELHYRNIVPKIIIEKYIEEMAAALYDYRFFCSYGDVKQIWLDVYSGTPNHKRKIYDRNWNELNITVKWPRLETPVEKPQKLADMIHFAEILSKEFSLVRVDFYLINDHIYFGEMTFTSMSGIGLFNPEKEDLKLGNMIKLPELAYNMDTGEYYKLPKKSKIKPYLLFPYYLWQKAHLERQKESYIEKLVVSQLSSSRIDIKNVGKENNAVEISTTEKVSAPAWFKNAQGQGQVLESNKERCQISIKVIQSGKLVLSFKSQDKRYEGGRFPLWVNYKSIKINGKEILSAPVETWHDKPFRYEMPVRDGQSIVVEIELQPHQYSKEELENIILKLFPNNEYIKQNMIHFLKHCAAFIKPTVKKQFHLFGITKTETSRTVYLFGLPLTFKNKHKEVLASLQQNQQSLLRAVKAVEDHNSRLEQQNAALSQQVNVMNRELQQSKLWIKQTYEAFPTINKQLLNAQNALLSQLVTERKVNRLAAIVSAVVKKQRKHNQEMQALLSKFISDTQFDLKYLKKVDVAKRAHLQQATDKLARQMQSAAQIQEKQLAGMQELLVSGQSTLQYLKGLDVAKTEHLQQAADKLAQQMQSAAQIQEKQLAGMQKLLVSGQSTLQYLKGLDVAKTEHLQQAADKLAQQMQSAAQMQEKQLAGMQELLLSGQSTLQYLKGVDVAKTEHLQQSADKLARQMQSAAQMQEKQLTGMRELLVSGQAALQHLKGLNVVNPEQLQQTAERLVAQITGASQEQARLLNAVSGSLRQQQQEASSQAGHIVGSLETLQKNHKTEQEDIKKQLRTIQDKSLQQYRELNFADLLHDSTKHSPWLKDRSFALYGWAANYSFIYTLFRILDKVSPQHILEMGLGQTTRLTTQYIAYKNPSATLDVCEHNQDWIDIYTPELPKSGNIKVHHLDLEYFDYDGKPNDKYKNISGVCGGTKYNLIIVDGPVGGGKNFPRSNVVDLIPHNLAEDFIIIFDDAERPGEQNTINKTLETLTSHGIQYKFSHRQASKKQFIITSKSWAFISLL